jgi:hypothetical protein
LRRQRETELTWKCKEYLRSSVNIFTSSSIGVIFLSGCADCFSFDVKLNKWQCCRAAHTAFVPVDRRCPSDITVGSNEFVLSGSWSTFSLFCRPYQVLSTPYRWKLCPIFPISESPLSRMMLYHVPEATTPLYNV